MPPAFCLHLLSIVLATSIITIPHCWKVVITGKLEMVNVMHKTIKRDVCGTVVIVVPSAVWMDHSLHVVSITTAWIHCVVAFDTTRVL